MTGVSGALGLYVPGDSPLHRLDPRVKLTLLALWTACLFSVRRWWLLLAVAAALYALGRATGLSAVRVLRGLAPLAVALAVVVLAGALRFDGTGEWSLAGSFGVSSAGLAGGVLQVARIVLMVWSSALVTASTSPAALNEALLGMLAPLRSLHLPVDSLATVASLALRFVPVVHEQLERVRDAQRARGARVGEGGPVRKVLSWVPVLIPLCVGLFRRSEALGRAMEARCYRSVGRTGLVVLRLRPTDVAVLAAGAVLAAVCVWC